MYDGNEIVQSPSTGMTDRENVLYLALKFGNLEHRDSAVLLDLLQPDPSKSTHDDPTSTQQGA